MPWAASFMGSQQKEDKVRKVKLFIYAIIALSIFLILRAYSQEAIIPSDVVKEDAALIEPKTAYVKPGNVTVNFKDADITAVLSYLAEVSGIDIVPAPDVSGPVTLKLTDKPWEVALDIIVKNYGYAYEREEDIIRVVTLDSLKLEELSTEVIPLNYTSAEDAQEAVKDMLTERGKLAYDSRVNSLIVTDLPTNIYKIKKIIKTLDKKTPQIMIEAKIIETTLGKTERLGIDWNLVIAARGAARPTTLPFQVFGGLPGVPHEIYEYLPRPEPAEVKTTYLEGGGAIPAYTLQDFPADWVAPFPFVGIDEFTYGTLDFTQFSAIIEYLKARSGTDIISNPRITTLNNKEAKMFVGKVYNYISEIEAKEDASGGERWEYTIEKEEIGIRLLVTPHINEKGDIEVELKPEIKDVIGFQQITQYFSLPIFSTREAETQVMVRDRDTIFIGGLIRERIIEKDKRFPILGDFFGDVPLIGPLFKHKVDEKEKTELVFFLTVHVVKDTKGLTDIALRDMSEIKIPLDAAEEVEQELGKKEKFTGIPKPVSRKEHKPLFDFRKKKKLRR